MTHGRRASSRGPQTQPTLAPPPSCPPLPRLPTPSPATPAPHAGFVRYWLSAGRGGFGLSGNACLGSAFYCIVYTHETPEDKLDGGCPSAGWLVNKGFARAPVREVDAFVAGEVSLDFAQAVALPTAGSAPHTRCRPALCTPACRVPAGLAREDEPRAHQGALLLAHQVQQLPAQRAQPDGCASGGV